MPLFVAALVAAVLVSGACCVWAAYRETPDARRRALVLGLVTAMAVATLLRLVVVPPHHAMYLDEPWYGEAACNLARNGDLGLCERTWDGVTCTPYEKAPGWPVLIAGFGGWGDAGSGATSALAYLMEDIEPDACAWLDPEACFDFTVQRPTTTRTPTGRWTLTYPRIQFFPVYRPNHERDLLLLTGPEPHMNWPTLTKATADFTKEMGVETSIALGVFEAVSQRMTSVDPARPLGYQPPEDWVKWHESVVATGTIPAPLDDLEAAYTNEFVEYWNQD